MYLRKADLDLHSAVRLLRDRILVSAKRLNALTCCWSFKRDAEISTRELALI
jgi:hypothetical protein